MTLAALIRKRESEKVATAIPAIPATEASAEAETVATIATVAVANPRNVKPETLLRDVARQLGHESDLPELLDWYRDDFDEIATMQREQLLALVADYFANHQQYRPELWSKPLVCCGDCAAFQRKSHPHLGHCARGEPEAIAGLWDTDRRYCEQYQGKQQGATDGA